MGETVTGYVSVRELNEFLDRMEKTGRECENEWIGGAVTATTGAIRKLIGLARKEDVAPVVRGVWIPTPCDMEDVNLFACSECKHLMYVSADYDEPNYCPNCGARMDEDE